MKFTTNIIEYLFPRWPNSQTISYKKPFNPLAFSNKTNWHILGEIIFTIEKLRDILKFIKKYLQNIELHLCLL